METLWEIMPQSDLKHVRKNTMNVLGKAGLRFQRVILYAKDVLFLTFFFGDSLIILYNA